jgi:hypothetical protein
MWIHVHATYRAGLNTAAAGITTILVQYDPIVPNQSVMRAGLDTFVLFACKTYQNVRRLGPFSFHRDAGSFGGSFAKMLPRTDGHADLAFSTKRTRNFDHRRILDVKRLVHEMTAVDNNEINISEIFQ